MYILTNVYFLVVLDIRVLGVVRSWLMYVIMLGKKNVGDFTPLLIGP